MTFQKLIAAFAVLMLVGCAAAPASSLFEFTARPASRAAQPETQRGFIHLGGAANAQLYVPQGYRPDQPAPFALVLTGAGGKGDRILHRFSALAESEGVILLTVDAADTTWGVITNGMRSSATNLASPDFGADGPRFDAALAQAFARFAIDPARVAVIGMSDGAGCAIALGESEPQLFRSVLAFSPGMVFAAKPGAHGRVFIAHGRQDRILPVSNTVGAIAPILRQAGFQVQLELFDGGHELKDDVMARGFAWWLHPPTR